MTTLSVEAHIQNRQCESNFKEPSKISDETRERVAKWRQECWDQHNSMTDADVNYMLDRGKKLLEETVIVQTLVSGGSAFFPHASIFECGHHIAAVVEAALGACIKSDKKEVLVLGVLHAASSKELSDARCDEESGVDVLNHPLRGIIPEGDKRLGAEFSLEHFKFLFKKATERSGLSIKFNAYYPHLASGHPESLPGIQELQELAKRSIVVATGDLCHHGEGYGTPKDKQHFISDEGLSFAWDKIEEGLTLLNDYIAYRDYCVGPTKSDSRDVGQTLSFLLGGLTGRVHKVVQCDTSEELFDGKKKAWVAASLVELNPI